MWHETNMKYEITLESFVMNLWQLSAETSNNHSGHLLTKRNQDLSIKICCQYIAIA